MSYIDLARDMIRADEGRRFTVYDDATGRPITKDDTLKGYPTIGYGRRLDSGRGLTLDEIEYLLANDLKVAEAAARKWAGPHWSGLSDARKVVLINLGHMLGEAKLRGFVRMRFELDDGDQEGVAAEMMASRWAGQVGARAQRLADAWRKDKLEERCA
jgi:lysozyme